jgi:hypothetical protein
MKEGILELPKTRSKNIQKHRAKRLITILRHKEESAPTQLLLAILNKLPRLLTDSSTGTTKAKFKTFKTKESNP